MQSLSAALADAGFKPAPETVAAPAAQEEIAQPEQASTGRPHMVVIHENPDLDALLGAWAYRKFVAKKAECRIVAVRSGESLDAESAEGFTVEHIDTGHGVCDQHGKGLERSSSFELFCKKYRLENEPGLSVLIELSKKADNVEVIPWDSIHYTIKGLSREFRGDDGEVDWDEVITNAFFLFEINYKQTRWRYQAKRDLKKYGRIETLKNGLQLAIVMRNPRLAGAAYEEGADLAFWTAYADPIKKWDGPFYMGIQCNRSERACLDPVIAAIRHAELAKRGAKVSLAGADRVEYHPQVLHWYYHDSRCLIVNGSESHPLQEGEYSRLTPAEVLNIIRTTVTPKTA